VKTVFGFGAIQRNILVNPVHARKHSFSY